MNVEFCLFAAKGGRNFHQTFILRTFISYSLLTDLTPKEIIDSYVERVQSGLWLCRACHKDFTCSGNVRAHVEAKHYSPGYDCPHCGKYFKIRNNYTQHIKTCKSKS